MNTQKYLANYSLSPLFPRQKRSLWGAKKLNRNMKKIILCGNLSALIFFSCSGMAFAEQEVYENCSDVKGGALYIDAPDWEIEDSVFANNKASEYGGGIYVTDTGELVLGKAFFHSNSSEYEGGALYNMGILTINEGIFLNNSSNDGGAIKTFIGNLTIGDGFFQNNFTPQHGGAINSYLGQLTITNGTFLENESEIDGGAIYNYFCDFTLTNGNFIDNKGRYGAALYNLGGNIDITNGLFMENEAVEYGGAIYDMTSSHILNIDNCLFIGNKAPHGGAIYSMQASLNVANGFFIDNEASGAGALVSSDSYLNFEKSVFIGNKAESVGAFDNVGYSKFGESLFLNNIAAENSGAVYNRRELDFKYVIFVGNESGRSGAAVYNNGDGFGTINPGRFTGSGIFAGNKTNSNEDLLYLVASIFHNDRSDVTLDKVIFVGNDSSISKKMTTGGSLSLSGFIVSNDYRSSLEVNGGVFVGNNSNNVVFIEAPNVINLANGVILNSSRSILNLNGSNIFVGNTFNSHFDDFYPGLKHTAGVIYHTGEELNFNLESGESSLFAGNRGVVVKNGEPVYYDANAVYITGGSFDDRNVNFNVAEGAVLDMRDSMYSTDITRALNINKTGAGVWKLGDSSYFNSVFENINFTVAEGTLYLYRAGEASDAYSTNATNMVKAGNIQIDTTKSIFVLKNGATLAAGGGDVTNSYGNLVKTAGNITLETGSTLSFDTGFSNGNNDLFLDSPLLKLEASSIYITGSDTIGIDLLSLKNHMFVLIDKSATGYNASFIDKISNSLTLRGESFSQSRLPAAPNLLVYPNKIELIIYNTANEVTTWTGAGDTSNDVWGIAAQNWSGTGSKFLHGDIVNFDGTGTVPAEIKVNPGGVLTAGIYVSGNNDYKFKGGSIIADASGGTTLSGSSANGQLLLGGKASSVNNVGITGFSGTADFTGTIDNKFVGGVFIESGGIRLSNFTQLGTNLSNLNLLTDISNAGGLSDAIDDFKDYAAAYQSDPSAANKQALEEARADYLNQVTASNSNKSLANLQIAEDSLVVFASVGNDEQRLIVADEVYSRIVLEDKAQFAITNNVVDAANGKIGGAVSIGTGAHLTLDSSLEDAKFIFLENEAKNTTGGAIYNLGSLTLGTGFFVNNEANGQDASGGAIYNSGIIDIVDGTFVANKSNVENEDKLTKGGAVYNIGTMNIAEGSFYGNEVYGDGAAVSNYNVLTMNKGIFASNIADGGDDRSRGGAIENAGIFELNEGVFISNVAGLIGGAIKNSGEFSLDQGTFIDNKAYDGGAIENTKLIIIKEGTFIKNTAAHDGGALENADYFEITDTATFMQNKAGNYGGAIDNWGTVKIGEGVFIGNTAEKYGGAVFNYRNFEITDTATFVQNKADSGGALFNWNLESVFNEAIFIGNEAVNRGGAIYNNGAKITLNSGVFTGNLANGEASSIYHSGNAVLNVTTISEDDVLDMRDQMGGNASDASVINIKKTGAGTWLLGGNNDFTASGTGSTVFAVDEGTLYLYRAEEVLNSNNSAVAKVENAHINLAGADSKFTLAEDTVLGLGIGDEAHQIKANTVTLTLGSKAELNYESGFVTSFNGENYHDVLILASDNLTNKAVIVNDSGILAVGAYDLEVYAYWDEENDSVLRLKTLNGNGDYNPDRGGSYAVQAPEAMAIYNPTTDIIMNRQKAVFTDKRGLFGETKQLGKNFWGTPFYRFSNMDNHGGQAGYKVKTPGFALGYDDNISDKTFLGVAITAAWPDYDSGNVTADATDIRLAVYGGTRLSKGWDLSYMAAYGWGNTDQKRYLDQFSYEGDYDYNTLSLGIGLAKDFRKSETSVIRPYVHYEYLKIKSDGYGEKGSGDMALRFEDKTSDLNRVRLGFDYIKETAKKDGYWRAGLFWLNQTGDRTAKTIAQFGNDPNSRFISYGVPEDENSLGVTVGYGRAIGKNSDLHLNYTGFYGSNSDSQEFSITFTRRF